jgi:hypothetical protein
MQQKLFGKGLAEVAIIVHDQDASRHGPVPQESPAPRCLDTKRHRDRTMALAPHPKRLGQKESL